MDYAIEEADLAWLWSENSGDSPDWWDGGITIREEDRKPGLLPEEVAEQVVSHLVAGFTYEDVRERVTYERQGVVGPPSTRTIAKVVDRSPMFQGLGDVLLEWGIAKCLLCEADLVEVEKPALGENTKRSACPRCLEQA